MKSFIKQLINSFLDLIYPPICLHCEKTLPLTFKIFCEECLIEFKPLNAGERCPYCFSADFKIEDKVCFNCRKKALVFTRVYSAFDLTGPAESLFYKLKSSPSSYLSLAGAAFLSYGYLTSHLPLPDFIIPLSQSFFKKLTLGESPHFQLAKQLAKILNCPLCPFPFSFKIFNKRVTMNQAKENLFQDKVILLVGDLMTDQGEMQDFAHLLAGKYPKSIYGVTLCRQI